MDPTKRATSFKTLHAFWLLLHEIEIFRLRWHTRLYLMVLARCFKRRYLSYMLKNTSRAEVEWTKLTQSFSIVLSSDK